MIWDRVVKRLSARLQQGDAMGKTIIVALVMTASFVLLWFYLLFQRANTSHVQLHFFLAKDAQFIEYAEVGGSDQVSFSIMRAFPDLDLTTDRLAILKAQGWDLCASGNDQWASFEDYASHPPTMWHQRLLHFQRANDIVVYTAMYWSELDVTGDRNQFAKPNTATQKIVVMRMSASDVATKTLLRSFGVRCK